MLFRFSEEFQKHGFVIHRHEFVKELAQVDYKRFCSIVSIVEMRIALIPKQCRCCNFLWRCLTCIARVKNLINRIHLFLYSITFFVILPIVCFNMKNSLYFVKHNEIGMKQLLLEKNSERINEARHYFEMLDQMKLNPMLQSFNGNQRAGSLRIAIMIITVSRNRHKIDSYEPMYLTQVVWKFLSLLQGIKAEGFLHEVTFGICNVDHDPGTYDEATNISHFVPVFQRFSKTHFSMVHTLEKEKQDYVFCLNRSLENDPDYVLLVEDDALPTADFFHVLDYTLNMHLNRRSVRGELVLQFEDIAFVKFYHPESLLSFWNLERERIPELIALTVLLGTVITIVYVFIVKDKKSNVSAITGSLFIYSFLVVAIIGRPNFTNLRSVLSPYLHTFTPAPSCCTPALLFPAKGAVEVISYLDKITCSNNFGKDSGLDNLLSERNLKAYLVQPNTFTHIGLYSSLRDKIVDPFIV